MRQEKIIEIEIETTLSSHLTTGRVIEIKGEPFLIVEILHHIGDFSTSKMQVVEPNWRWKLRYKALRFLRQTWHTVTGPLRRFWRKLRGR